jgi:hypothetical protein
VGYQGRCRECSRETELVHTTDVCEECLLRLSAEWDFCMDCLRSFKKTDCCPKCGKVTCEISAQ